MKNLRGALLVGVGLVIGCAGATTRAVFAEPAANPAAPKWQHTCRRLDVREVADGEAEQVALLAGLGADGWELVTSVGTSVPGTTFSCFKRPAPAP